MYIHLDYSKMFVTLSYEPEHTFIGDHFDDQETIDQITEEWENGNDWAWCNIAVTVHYMGLTSVQYLGCCSYESEEDFVDNSGYYDDMGREAIAEIIEQVESIIDFHLGIFMKGLDNR